MLVGAQHQNKYNLPFLGWLINKIAKLLRFSSLSVSFSSYSLSACRFLLPVFIPFFFLVQLLLLVATFGIFIMCFERSFLAANF